MQLEQANCPVIIDFISNMVNIRSHLTPKFGKRMVNLSFAAFFDIALTIIALFGMQY
jgi:hypothetical protein